MGTTSPQSTGPETLPLEYQSRPQTSHFRWWILGLVFLGTTVNYVDRLVMGLLAPDLKKWYSISDSQYGYIQGAFAISYAVGQLISGGILDKVGVRMGYAIALVFWSISSILHAFAIGFGNFFVSLLGLSGGGAAWGFGIMRGLLGFSESPNFPAATKTIAEWFPRKERALAMGFVNAGTNVGAVVAPAVVPILAVTLGWQWAFIMTGAIGVVWIVLWLPLYRHPHEHPRVSATELAFINSDPPEPTVKIPWVTLLGYKQAWAFAIGKFLTDSMWWFYMTWFPVFLNKNHGLNLVNIGLPLVVVYLMADIGSIGGGWLSSSLIKRGSSVNRARKIALLVCALGVIPIVFAQNIHNLWWAVMVLGLCTASHQGFSSNLYTLVSDTFPKRAVASVAGLGGTCGYIGATIFQVIVGNVVEKQGHYHVPFICAGIAYIVAFGVIQWLAPRLEPAIIEDKTAAA